ncbi:MAG: hypothetical protein PVF51_06305 [Nitrospirota bacterium]
MDAGRGDDDGPAITLTLTPGGSVAVGAPTITAALRDSGGASANDLVRLTLGSLPPLANGGRYELWAVDVVSGISSLDTFISCGRFNTEVTPQAAFVQLPGSAKAVDPVNRGVDFAQVESDEAALAPCYRSIPPTTTRSGSRSKPRTTTTSSPAAPTARARSWSVISRHPGRMGPWPSRPISPAPGAPSASP